MGWEAPRRSRRSRWSRTQLPGETYPDAAKLTGQVQGRLARVVHHAGVGLVLQQHFRLQGPQARSGLGCPSGSCCPRCPVAPRGSPYHIIVTVLGRQVQGDVALVGWDVHR